MPGEVEFDHKQIETELRESEQRLRYVAYIVESSDDAIVSKNLDGIIMSWNGGTSMSSVTRLMKRSVSLLRC